jgi:hypothetical protein
MRIKLNCIAPLLAAGVAAVAIAGAPTAAAAPAQSAAGASVSSAPSDPSPAQQCTSLGGTQTVCQSAGNAQVYDSPPQVDFYPYAGGGT